VRRGSCGKTSSLRSSVAGLALAGALVVLGAGTAAAAPVAHPQTGRLPGFPRVRGVVPVLSSSSAVSAREALIRGAFASARAGHQSSGGEHRGTAVRNEGQLGLRACTQPAEKLRSRLTQAMCYRGGPVLRGPTLHVIFWQGPATPKVEPFPTGYVELVKEYLAGLAHDSGQLSNVFSLDPQYFEEVAGTPEPGEYKFTFEPAKDIAVDATHALPTHTAEECPDKTKFSEGACLLDSDLHEEIGKVIKEEAEAGHGWEAETLKDAYLVVTPPGVGGCIAKGAGECAFTTYCAYHGDFGGDGMTPGHQTVYGDLPYIGKVPGCDFEVHPNEVEDHGADAVINTTSHELNEMVTDPIGSQCDEGAPGEILGCEPNAWTDAIGQEIADKCQLPNVTVAGSGSTFGEPWKPGLGALSYNQVVNGKHYFTQRQWSNEGGGLFEEAGDFEGACQQQTLSTSTVVSPNPAAGVPTTFSPSGSGAEGDAADYWVWNFGDGEQVGTPSSSIAHTYSIPGEYQVAVTSYDAFGSSLGRMMKVRIGPAPPPPPHESTNATATVTVAVTTAVTQTANKPVAHYSSSQLAAALGLPPAGAKLGGLGTLTFGHGACPPACSVSGSLSAKVKSSSRGRHVTKTVQIGSVSLTIASAGTGTIALNLNSRGRSLLRSKRSLSAQLQLTVTGQEGGTWLVTRSFTLTSTAGKSSRGTPRRR
jgi:hypothetical protein